MMKSVTENVVPNVLMWEHLHSIIKQAELQRNVKDGMPHIIKML